MTTPDQRLRARALLVIPQRVLADVMKLALNHGQHTTRLAATAVGTCHEPLEHCVREHIVISSQPC